MATDSERLALLETRLALEELNSNFCYFLDHGHIEKLLDLFTENAEYSHGTRRSHGREEIAKVFNRRTEAGPRTARHLYSGLHIEILSPTQARGTSVCMTFAYDGVAPVAQASPHLVADFIDEYTCDAGGTWRIGKRHIERIFVAENNTGPVGQTPENTGS